jgi:hypothetical protein
MKERHKKLRAQLEGLGWKPVPHGSQTFRCTHRTTEGLIDVFVRMTDHWLIASVVPFLATRGDNSFELSRWLLRQNRDMLQAKFAYDEDGDVVLTTEVPTEALDVEEVQAALSGLLAEAIRHRATLRQAAAAAR